MNANDLKEEIMHERNSNAIEMGKSMKSEEIGALKNLIKRLDLEVDWKGEQKEYLEKYGRDFPPSRK